MSACHSTLIPGAIPGIGDVVSKTENKVPDPMESMSFYSSQVRKKKCIQSRILGNNNAMKNSKTINGQRLMQGDGNLELLTRICQNR